MKIQSCFKTGRWYRTRVIKVLKLHALLVHILSFKVTKCSFSHLPIDNTTERFICQVQRRKMPPKVYMTENEKLRAIGMLEAGQSQNSIARHFGKSKSVISRLVVRYRQTGGVKIRDGRGRHKKTTPRQDRYLRIIALRNRFISAPQLRDTFRGVTGIRISKSTVHNRLRAVGLKARRPFKGMQLTRAHKRLRNQWAQRHIGRQQRHWRYTMFSDESRFCLNFTDGRKRVWRRVGERYHPATVQQHDR